MRTIVIVAVLIFLAYSDANGAKANRLARRVDIVHNDCQRSLSIISVPERHRLLEQTCRYLERVRGLLNTGPPCFSDVDAFMDVDFLLGTARVILTLFPGRSGTGVLIEWMIMSRTGEEEIQDLTRQSLERMRLEGSGGWVRARVKGEM